MRRLQGGVFIIFLLCAWLASGCGGGGGGGPNWAIGGAGNDQAMAVAPAPEGGYVVVGKTDSMGSGGFDVYVLKVGEDGSLEWQRTLGGANDDMGRDIEPTSDGGYIVAAQTRSFGAGEVDFYVLKLDAEGGRVWEKTFGEEKSELATCVIPTSDGGYLVGGAKWVAPGNYNGYLVKLRQDGSLEWEKDYSEPSCDEIRAVVEVEDGYVIGGFAIEDSDYKAYVAKVGRYGTLEWERTYEEGDRIYDLVRVSDGYIGVGWTTLEGGNEQAFILKVDESGNLVWHKNLGEEGEDETLASVTQTADGDFVAVGGKTSGGVYDLYVVRFDTDGSVKWTKVIGGGEEDYGEDVLALPDGCLLVVGRTASYGSGNFDVYLLKLDAGGEASPFLKSF